MKIRVATYNIHKGVTGIRGRPRIHDVRLALHTIDAEILFPPVMMGLFLRLRGCDGIRGAFIDAGMQDEIAIRRLVRRLEWVPRGGSESENGQADTIPPQGLKCVTRH